MYYENSKSTQSIQLWHKGKHNSMSAKGCFNMNLWYSLLFSCICTKFTKLPTTDVVCKHSKPDKTIAKFFVSDKNGFL